MSTKKTSITALMTASTSSLAPIAEKVNLRPSKSQQKLKPLKDKRRHSALGLLLNYKKKSSKDLIPSPLLYDPGTTDQADSSKSIDAAEVSVDGVEVSTEESESILRSSVILCLADSVDDASEIDGEESAPFYDDLWEMSRSPEKASYVFTRQKTIRIKKPIRPRSYGDALGITYEDDDGEQVDFEVVKEKLRQASLGLSDGDVNSQVFVPVSECARRDPVDALPNVPSMLPSSVPDDDPATEEKDRIHDTLAQKEEQADRDRNGESTRRVTEDVVPDTPVGIHRLHEAVGDTHLVKPEEQTRPVTKNRKAISVHVIEISAEDSASTTNESFTENTDDMEVSDGTVQMETADDGSDSSFHSFEDSLLEKERWESFSEEHNIPPVEEQSHFSVEESKVDCEMENESKDERGTELENHKETEWGYSNQNESGYLETVTTECSQSNQTDTKAKCDLMLEENTMINMSDPVESNRSGVIGSGFGGRATFEADELDSAVPVEEDCSKIEDDGNQSSIELSSQFDKQHEDYPSISTAESQFDAARKVTKEPDELATHILRDNEYRVPHSSVEKHCNACKCARDSHDVIHQDPVNVKDRVGLKDSNEGQAIMSVPSKNKGSSSDIYTWIPTGLGPDKVEEYMRALPRDKVPKRGSAGERWRERQLASQLPRQDLALAYCRYVEPQNHESYQDFVAARNDIALDIAYVKDALHRTTNCYHCASSIAAGSVAVMTPKFGEAVAWHPACFQCSTCNEILVDLTYCVHDEQIYCERHYAEQLKPRCGACDELIFSGEYTKAMSKDWHLGHFSCWQCDESLTGQRYVLRDDHPYCVKCYETVFANMCDDCGKQIGIDSKDLSYKERHWHEACFLCTKCGVSLVDKQFGSKSEKIYCGGCYDSMFATRCDACGEIFRAGTKKMEYKSRQWHEKCFCCCMCKTAIGTKSFIPRDQDIYCTGCYEEKFATRCVKCNKIITSGGVTYKNEPWHRECFTCTHCDKSLAGQRFTSRDEKPYCAECFGELFAKRCTACVKPITGIGGTRFISFEDRHWHNDCFVCASCTTSLVGKGFITDGADILCPECAKQRVL